MSDFVVGLAIQSVFFAVGKTKFDGHFGILLESGRSLGDVRRRRGSVRGRRVVSGVGLRARLLFSTVLLDLAHDRIVASAMARRRLRGGCSTRVSVARRRGRRRALVAAEVALAIGSSSDGQADVAGARLVIATRVDR